MAHIEDSKSGGRSVNVDVNIVPFIDLMSVLIIFLLVTAVWTQVSMIQIGSSIYGKKQQDQEEVKPPPRAEIPFRVDVMPEGYRIVIGKDSNIIAKKDGEYNNEKFVEELKKIKEIYPEKSDVVVTMRDELNYEYLIGAMDSLLIEDRFPEISIATSGAE